MKKFFIGLDQSSKKTGYAVLDIDGKLLEYGVFSITGNTPIIRGSALIVEIFKVLNEYLKNGIIGLEDIKGSISNYKTTITLAKVLGMIEYVLDEHQIDYKVVAPGTWRSSCGIKGRDRATQKKNAIARVKEKYGIEMKEDAAEAACIAEYLYKEHGW